MLHRGTTYGIGSPSSMTDYQFIHWLDYIALPDQEETWVVEPLVPSGGWFCIYGKPKTGKSLLALNMAIAVSTGRKEWLGFPIHRHGPVAYFQADNPRSLWRGNHLKRLIAGGQEGDIWFADPYTMPYPFDILAEGNAEILADMIARLPIQPIVVLVDTIREVHSADENASGDMRQVIALLREAAGPDPALGLVSHSRKGLENDSGADRETGSQIMDDVRGNSYVPGKMDTMIKLTDHYMHYKGRACGLKRLKVRMDDFNIWHVEQDELAEELQKRVDMRPHASTRKLAKEMAQDLDLPEEKVRSMLRRMKGELK